MRNLFTKIALLAVLFVSNFAFAKNEASTQLSYWKQLGYGFFNVMIVVMLIGSLIIILGAVFMFFKDYVVAKDEREKKFSVPQLFMGAVAASILAVPTGIYVIANDVLTGAAGNSEVTTDVFKEKSL